jgi:hypothetical protein
MKLQNFTHRRVLRSTLCLSTAVLIAAPTVSATSIAERTKVDISGKIIAAVIADSDVSGMGVNNLPNGLYNKSDDGSIAIDTTLTRLNFGTHTALEGNENLSSFISFDFNDSNSGKMDLRVREAYVNWSKGNGSLTLGQTWSTLMDMNKFPDTLLEPTLSGVVFTRQPMVRWSQTFGTFSYDVAIENGTNRVQTDQQDIDLDTSSKFPDLVVAVENATDSYWFRAAGVVNHITVKDRQQDKTISDNGWAFQLSGGVKFDEKDHFSIAYFNSLGNDRYVLGVSQTGPMLQPTTGEFELRESESLWTSVGHSWTDSLKSTVAYGIWNADEISGQSDTFTQTEFALANVKWTAKEHLVFGIEYNYTTYERSVSDSRDNHRIIFAVDYTF